MIRMVRLVLVLAAIALGLTPATAGTHAWSRMVDCARPAGMVSAHAAHAGQDMLEDHGAAGAAKSVLSHDCCLTAVQAILAATAVLARPVLSPAAEPLVPTALDGLVITPSPPPPKIRV